jgi:hypothetical protein
MKWSWTTLTGNECLIGGTGKRLYFVDLAGAHLRFQLYPRHTCLAANKTAVETSILKRKQLVSIIHSSNSNQSTWKSASSVFIRSRSTVKIRVVINFFLKLASLSAVRPGRPADDAPSEAEATAESEHALD